jgi:23S rRNA A1618 N6-methylase RlmF
MLFHLTGTGSSCIYPLLAAKRMGWKMLATEVDPESADCAAKNVRNNKLDNLISGW